MLLKFRNSRQGLGTDNIRQTFNWDWDIISRHIKSIMDTVIWKDIRIQIKTSFSCRATAN
uniref:Uncharacterized protein n=1 Tax=Arundo donax TaxID=35708 RepID=A0A0A9CX86_ARUDO